jgi:hypothetical protein
MVCIWVWIEILPSMCMSKNLIGLPRTPNSQGLEAVPYCASHEISTLPLSQQLHPAEAQPQFVWSMQPLRSVWLRLQELSATHKSHNTVGGPHNTSPSSNLW